MLKAWTKVPAIKKALMGLIHYVHSLTPDYLRFPPRLDFDPLFNRFALRALRLSFALGRIAKSLCQLE